MFSAHLIQQLVLLLFPLERMISGASAVSRYHKNMRLQHPSYFLFSSVSCCFLSVSHFLIKIESKRDSFAEIRVLVITRSF